MNERLILKIKEKMDSQHLTVHALEKEAGLKPQAVRNILWGKSKNPGAAVLKGIAKVLNCSIDELLGDNNPESSSFSHSAAYQELDIKDTKLFREVNNEAISLYESHKYEPTIKEFIFLIMEVYTYSLERNSGKLDRKFADWLYAKNFS